jgi:hypothetical protein
MIKKTKTLFRTIRTTKIIRGSRVSFVVYFFITHGLNGINRICPTCARLFRKALRTKRAFIIQNSIGIFEVAPLNDSMTISADYFEAQLLHNIDRPKRKKLFVDIGQISADIPLRHRKNSTIRTSSPSKLIQSLFPSYKETSLSMILQRRQSPSKQH